MNSRDPSQNQARLWLGRAVVGLQAGLAYLLIFGLAAFVASFFLAGGDQVELALGLSLVSYVSFLLWLTPLSFLLDRQAGQKFSAKSLLARLDLQKPTWREVGWGLIVVLAVLQLISLLALAFDWLGLADSAQRQSLFELVPAGGWGLFWFFVAACLLVPTIEEIVFRRWLFRPLDGRFGFGPALAVSSVLFGLVHFDPAAPAVIIWTAGLGAVLAAVYRWSGKLWVPIIMHATVNALSMATYVLGY